MESFRDRVVLITGAASGIGRQLALSLAAEGAYIAAVDLQAEALERLAPELPSASAWAAVDVADLTAMREGVAKLEAQLGPTDLLVASAGVGIETPAENFRAEDFNAQIRVNLIGVVNAIDAVLPGMCQRRRGHIAALSSMASYRGLPHMGGYCASKAGVNSLLDSLRVELRDKGIAVTTICPAWIRTPMTAPLDVPQKEMMAVEDAVRLMVSALRARKSFLAFPSASVWQGRLLRHTPQRLSDWLVGRWLRRAMKRRRR